MFIIVITILFLTWCISAIISQLREDGEPVGLFTRPRTREQDALDIIGDYILLREEETGDPDWPF